MMRAIVWGGLAGQAKLMRGAHGGREQRSRQEGLRRQHIGQQHAKQAVAEERAEETHAAQVARMGV